MPHATPPASLPHWARWKRRVLRRVLGTYLGVALLGLLLWDGPHLQESPLSALALILAGGLLLGAVLQGLARRHERTLARKRRLRRELDTSLARYQALFDAAPLPMWVVDLASSRILAVNDAAAERYGYSKVEFCRLDIFELRPPEERERLHSFLASTAASELPRVVRMGVWTHQARNGERFEVDVSSCALSFAGRDARLVLARDVSETVRTERQLQQMRDQLSALAQRLLGHEQSLSRSLARALHDGIAHHLVLAGLRLDQFGEQGMAAPALLGQGRAHVRDGLQALRDLLHDLRPVLLDQAGLAIAIADALDQGPGPERVFEASADARQTRWSPEVESALFMIFREALTNALQHAKPRRIRVELEGDAQSCRLVVEDDGAGLPIDAQRARPGHLGLIGMRERALGIGATFLIGPAADGGTRIEVGWRAHPQD